MALQPLWVQFLVMAAIFAVFWGVATGVVWRSPVSSIWSTVVFAVFFGVTLAAFFIYRGQAAHKALGDAVAGLDKAERSQAIAAVTRGVVPADATVRSSAIRLGAAYLGGKSADQLKRQERQTWIVLAFLVALCIVAAIYFSEDGLYYVALALIGAVGLTLGVLSTRRIQRNIALLAEGATSR